MSAPRGARTGDTLPALRYGDGTMLTPADQISRETEVFDARAVAAELEGLADVHSGNERELRMAVSRRLKAALVEGRAAAERLLISDRHGRRCAERLCFMQDEIIRVLFEFATKHLYTAQNPSEAEHMAIVATGGYGRGVLAAGSDIDLLFLLPYKQTAWGESIAEAILYCLWDMGLKVGHATRSVSECIRQAKSDMTIRTAVLEARFLLGDHKLFDELVARFDKEVVQGTAAEFVAAKLAEREERHRRAGQSRYLVEPNVKDGKGGLRDLHTLYWIAKYVYRVREREQLIEKGVYDPREYRRFRRCGDFLWAVRCHMHFLTGRAEERLSFDIQREIAVRLGYTEHPGLRDVERFMKHYFLIAKDVGDLTAILCAKLEDSQAKAMPVLSRMMARFRPRARHSLSETEDFIVDYNRINVVEEGVFKRDPVNLIRIFHLAQKYNLAFHPDAMHIATRSLKLIDQKLREDEEANRLFLEILTSKNDAETVLRRMNEAGVLGRFVPAFGRIVAMMQFNMYHHYTVDEHLLRCVGDPLRHRGRPHRRHQVRQRADAHHSAAAPGAALRHAVPARHRQGPHRGSLHRRRARRPQFLPAARLHAGGDGNRCLADRGASRDVDGRAIARSLRPHDDREFQRGRAVGRAHEAPDHPHRGRHQGGRARRVERLEGAAHPLALLRDRARAHRRLFRGQPRAARRHGANRVPRRARGLDTGRDRRLHRAALSGLLAQGRPAAEDRSCPLPARSCTGRQIARDRRSRSARRAALPSSP